MNLQDVLSGLKGGHGVDNSKQNTTKNTVTVQGNTRPVQPYTSKHQVRRVTAPVPATADKHCNESYVDIILQRARRDKRKKHCANDTWENHIINILIKDMIFWVRPLFYAQLITLRERSNLAQVHE